MRSPLCWHKGFGLALCGLLLYTIPLVGQSIIPQFKRLDRSDGLSDNNVFTILQDKRGFMWFGTQLGGLNRYDGYHFQHFKPDPAQADSISSMDVRSLHEDAAGNLWVGTIGGGLNRYDRDTQGFSHYQHDPGDDTSLSQDTVTAITSDSSGGLWVGTLGGLNKLDLSTGGFVRYPAEEGHAKSLSGLRILALAIDDDYGLWVGSNRGLDLLDIRTGSVIHYPFPNQDVRMVRALGKDTTGTLWTGGAGGVHLLKPGGQQLEPLPKFAPQTVTAIVRGPDDSMLIASEEGFSIYDSASGEISLHRHDPGNSRGLSADKLYAAHVDRSGLLWLATYGYGLNTCYLKGRRFGLHYADPTNPNTILDNSIYEIYEDSQSVLWVGSKKGLTRFGPDANQVTHFLHNPSDATSIGVGQVCAVHEDRQGRFWVGTIGGGLSLMNRESGAFSHFPHQPDNPQTISADRVFYIHEDNSGILWIGTFGGGLNRFDPDTGLARRFPLRPREADDFMHPAVMSIHTDRDGILWLATYDGLNKMTPTGDDSYSFQRFAHQKDNPTGLAGNVVTFLAEDRKGRFWVGSSGGLMLKENDQFKTYNTENGLPDNMVYSLLEDGRGNLWMGTNRGLTCFDPESETFTNYLDFDGLQDNEFNVNAAFARRNGDLVFGGTGGINSFTPAAITPIPRQAAVVMTDLLLANRSSSPGEAGSPLSKAVDETRELSLNHHQKMVTLAFSALDFVSPQDNRFMYRMLPLDPEWIPAPAGLRRATYTRLSPGDHIFQVKAAPPGGSWGEPIGLAIHVDPPPWLSWWAKLLYTMAALALLLIILQVQRTKLARERALNRQLVQLDKMKDQFIANTGHELRTPLNGMIGLAESLLAQDEEAVSPQARGDLAMIAAGGRQLAGLVEDILDLSKLREKGLDIHRQAVALQPLAQTVIALQQTFLAGKDVVLENQIPNDAPMAYADGDRITQVLHNLVGNAIKFTQQGSVRLSAVWDDREITLSVSDTGIGISASQQEQIFETFAQADASITRRFGGIGLGLAISRELVELSGGRIWVTSELEQGSTFSFTLPLAPDDLELPVFSAADVQPAAIQEQAPDQPTIEEPEFTILVVDDEPVNRQVLLRHLSHDKYRVVQASNGYEALNFLEEQPMDLVILDVMMPRLSGFQVCREMRKRFKAHELPVLFLTARTRAEDVTQGFEQGANDYLSKPIHREELRRRVQIQLQLLHINRNLEQEVTRRTEYLTRVQEGLLAETHRAGMAEIATDVLHNVGNVLNSVGTSIQMIDDFSHERGTLDMLHRIETLLGDHCDNPAEFFDSERVKGLHLLITKIHEAMDREKKELRAETSQLIEYLEELSAVVAEQHRYTEADRKLSAEDLNDIIAQSLAANAYLLDNGGVDVIYQPAPNLPRIYLSRDRVLRVLLCLYQNAIEAVAEVPNRQGRLSIETALTDSHVRLSFTDNGGGIEREDRQKIFAYGYTTKSGHRGFGLHYCANVIRELGGTILPVDTVERGACIQVCLPFGCDSESDRNQ